MWSESYEIFWKVSGKNELPATQEQITSSKQCACKVWNSYINFFIFLAVQKLKRRQTALAKTSSMTTVQKEKWAFSLTAEFMSSEESASESEENEGKFIIRPIPWRSEKISSFFASLDKKAAKNQSRRSVRMTMGRKPGLPSHRAMPTGLPQWAIKTTQ